MKKQRFFVIKSEIHGSEFYFQDLDGAMELFKYLMTAKATTIKNKNIQKIKISKERSWDTTDDFHYIAEEPEYHLSSVIKEIYTLEEIKQIDKDRNKKRKALKKGKKNVPK